MRTIIVDTREKPHAITKILAYFDKQKIPHISTKLFVGDYQRFDNPLVVVDRKQSLSEIVQNLGSDSGRFLREVRAAHELGIKLIVLCEHGGKIKQLADVASWANPMKKKYPYAMSGRELMERMYRVHIAYGVEFMFCDKRCTGRRIAELLEVGK